MDCTKQINSQFSSVHFSSCCRVYKASSVHFVRSVQTCCKGNQLPRNGSVYAKSSSSPVCTTTEEISLKDWTKIENSCTSSSRWSWRQL